MALSYNAATKTITVSGVTASIDNVYTTINNSSILSKKTDANGVIKYTLAANISVSSDAVLNINGPEQSNEISYSKYSDR